MSPKFDRIAVSAESFPRSLKQQLLFFDRVGYDTLENLIAFLHGFKHYLANDLEFLRDRGVIFDLIPFQMKGAKGELTTAELEAYQDQLMPIVEHLSKLVSEGVKGANRSQLSEVMARMSVVHMRLAMGLDVSVVSSKPLTLPQEIITTLGGREISTDVIDVVLSKFPVPSENTPWEAILDFKADTDAQGYLQGLRVWMGEVARQDLTPTEANEKIEWLIFQHKKHLEMHKMSYRLGTFSGTFIATLEILEDLAKFKWSKAAEAVISIVDRKLHLIKAELSNPAKEVSYIVMAQDRFGA